MKLTSQDMEVLQAVIALGGVSTAFEIARKARIFTAYPGETASRHLHKLLKLGLVEKFGSRSSEWGATDAGREKPYAGKMTQQYRFIRQG